MAAAQQKNVDLLKCPTLHFIDSTRHANRMGTKKMLTCCEKIHEGRREKIPCHRKMHATIDEIETKWRPKCAVKKRRDSNSGEEKSMRNSKIDDINSRRACHCCCCCNRRCDSSDSSTQFNYGSKDKQSVVALLVQSIFFPLFLYLMRHISSFSSVLFIYFFRSLVRSSTSHEEYVAGGWKVCVLCMRTECVVCWKMTAAFVKLAGDAECRILSGHRHH